MGAVAEFAAVAADCRLVRQLAFADYSVGLVGGRIAKRVRNQLAFAVADLALALGQVVLVALVATGADLALVGAAVAAEA